MRVIFLALAMSCPAAAEDLELEPRFDLRQESAGGVTIIAVLNRATGAFSIASGEGDLDLLEGDAARQAFKMIFGGENLDQEPSDPGDHRAPGRSGRGIVVHKMDYEEDDGDPLFENEVRVIKRHARDFGEQDEFPGDAAFEPDRDDARREIKLLGTDRREAANFIDEADGLDADEKAAMKEAAGVAE